ncbi:MAG: porin [bacterium]
MRWFSFNMMTILSILFGSLCFAQESKLKVYGYFDLEIEVSNKDAAAKRWTFDQHHFNVVTIYRLNDCFRVFGEIEWEHGISLESGGSGSGLVALERAWVEYKHSDGLKIKAGKFLPPFGIYNLKHDATPTFLSSFLPNAIYGKHTNTSGGKQRLYAKFATGVQVLGTLFSGQWQGDYYLYLSNGRGAQPGEKDDNSNKGVGARLEISPPLEELKLGVSFYTDKNGTANNTKQTTLAFDVALRRSNFLIEAEYFAPRLEKVDTLGVPVDDFRTSRGFYVQAAYTLLGQLTPFAQLNFFDPDSETRNDGESDIVFGLNLSLTPRVYLKSEVHFLRFQNANSKEFELYMSSIAVAF